MVCGCSRDAETASDYLCTRTADEVAVNIQRVAAGVKNGRIPVVGFGLKAHMGVGIIEGGLFRTGLRIEPDCGIARESGPDRTAVRGMDIQVVDIAVGVSGVVAAPGHRKRTAELNRVMGTGEDGVEIAGKTSFVRTAGSVGEDYGVVVDNNVVVGGIVPEDQISHAIVGHKIISCTFYYFILYEYAFFVRIVVSRAAGNKEKHPPGQVEKCRRCGCRGKRSSSCEECMTSRPPKKILNWG